MAVGGSCLFFFLFEILFINNKYYNFYRPTKERLKSYFQSSSRRLTLACEEGVKRSTRHVHDHVGVANVAYTQQGHADSVSVSNDEKENLRDGNLYHASPDLLVNASVHTE